jgi:GNAT superfamily N-acetyltransferase
LGTADRAAGWRGEIRRAEVADADGVAGLGAALMGAFKRWAAAEGCALVALATRRAAPFYVALGYEESAAYFRKVLDACGA